MRVRAAGGGAPVRLPPHAPGMRIGLYGGSFDPPHPGHRHVALSALKRLGLDRVWWLVSPGNPLKDRSRLAASGERLAAARALARHPRMAVTDVESRIGAVYTVETIAFLLRRAPAVRFVWVMGADSLAGFDRWRGWVRFAHFVPLAAVDRPGSTLRAPRGKAAVRFARARMPERAARALPGRAPPAWTLLTGPRNNLSSSALRDKSSRPKRMR